MFETSSDIKVRWTEKFLHQKLDYIHANPVSDNWSLVDDPAKYPYSSAGFYMLGTDPFVPLLHMGESMCGRSLRVRRAPEECVGVTLRGDMVHTGSPKTRMFTL